MIEIYSTKIWVISAFFRVTSMQIEKILHYP